MTNDHKPGGLKQQKFILPQFWRTEVQNEDVGRGTFPSEAPEEISSLPLPASGDCQHSWACGCPLQLPPVSSHGLLFLPVWVCSSSYWDMSLALGPTWRIQDDLELRPLLTSAKTPFLNKVTVTVSRD